MADLGELVVRIKADSAQLDRELKRVQGTLQQSAGKMSGAVGGLKTQFAALIPAITISALVVFTRNAIVAADALNDLSARTGVSAQFLSSMRTEIENSGGSIEGFAQALFFMNRQLGEAIKDINGPVAQAFQQLGLSINQMLTNKPEENFRLIAQAISQLPTEFERAEAAASLFGRGVAGLQPIIRNGAAGIDEILEKSERLGGSLSNEQLQAIDDFGDAMNTLGDTLQNLAAGAFANVVIVFQDMMGAVRDAKDQVELFLAGGTDALAYMEKARAGGFVTQATRGTLIESQPYGPALRAQAAASKRAGGGANAAEQERNRILEEGRRLTEQNMTALERYEAARASAAELFAKNAINEQTYQRELIRLQEDLNQEIGDGTTKAAEQAVINAKLIKDSFGDALESAMFDFKSFGSAASSILDGIARNLARSKLIDPLSGAASGLFDSLLSGGSISQSLGFATTGGYGPFPGFASGGRPQVGRPSIVGERGPEIFVPDSAGTVLPNGVGGGGVTVVNNWYVSPGVEETVEIGLRRAAPSIVSQSVAATMQAIQRGGAEARIVGKRN